MSPFEINFRNGEEVIFRLMFGTIVVTVVYLSN